MFWWISCFIDNFFYGSIHYMVIVGEFRHNVNGSVETMNFWTHYTQTFLFIQIYSPRLDSAPPRWVHFAHGLLLFLYQVWLNSHIALLAHLFVLVTLFSNFLLASPVLLFWLWWTLKLINFTYSNGITCLESWLHWLWCHFIMNLNGLTFEL